MNGILRSEGVGSFGVQEVKAKGEGEQWNWRFCALLSWRRSPRDTKTESVTNRAFARLNRRCPPSL